MTKNLDNDYFDVKIPEITFSDLILSSRVLADLSDSLQIIRNAKIIYDDWGLGRLTRGKKRFVLNLFGPPGTGKTECAEAIAKELDRSLLRLNYAAMESKYVGDTAKNIARAFQFARENQLVMHWDEADTILGRRLTNVTQSADHAVNTSRTTMLLELESHTLPIIFSTNLVRNYDKAFERRIDFSIEFKLPDLEERKSLIRLVLTNELPKQPSLNIDSLAQSSEGLSPADFKKAILIAVARMFRPDRQVRALGNEDMECAFAHIRAANTTSGSSDAASATVDTAAEIFEAGKN